MRRRVQIAAGIGLGLLLLWLVFRDTDWPAVWNAVRESNKVWLAISLIMVVVTFFTRSQRWSYIVRTAKPVSYRSLFHATQLGFLGNFVLPLRAGELIRALALSRMEAIPVTKTIAFVALDRVTDLAGVVVAALIATAAFRPPGSEAGTLAYDVPTWAEPLLDSSVIRNTSLLFAATLCGMAVFLVLLYTNQNFVLRVTGRLLGLLTRGPARRWPSQFEGLADRLVDMLRHFAEGLHILRSPSAMAYALCWSFVTWSAAIFSYHAAIAAFGVALPWYGAIVTIILLSVAITLPGAPGFVGQFHLGVILGVYVVAPSTDADVLRAIALVSHLVNLVPILAVGFYCVATDHMGLFELQQESKKLADEV